MARTFAKRTSIEQVEEGKDLAPKFERATGHKLALAFATGGATVKRVQGGEVFDVVITLQQGIDTLTKEGKAPAGNVTALASAGAARNDAINATVRPDTEGRS